jgi:hypothetical protein
MMTGGWSCFSSVPPGKFRDNTTISPLPLPFKSFPIHLPSYQLALHNIAAKSFVE